MRGAFSMGRKSKVDYESKIKAVQAYLEGISSVKSLAKQLNVAESRIKEWVRSYKILGTESLMPCSRNNVYSAELKILAVEEYLSGNGSPEDVRLKYGLKSRTQLKNWIKKYNGHMELKSSNSGGTPMTKGRNTTFKERVEIVEYCIKHNNNYIGTVEEFKISYQQIYSWMRKYDKGGIDALQDKRGRSKPKDEMTDIEKLKMQNKLLQAEIRKKEMEIDFLKKIKEIERRRS